MMALFGQWLGFTDSERTSPSSSSSSPSPPSSTPPHAGGIVIAKRDGSDAGGDSKTPAPTLRKTKSDELLRDFEVMRFLCSVDERLKRHRQLLSPAQQDRLQTLHAQAHADDCPLLSDILDHFELEHGKLQHRLACAAPNSAAGDAARSRHNTLVF